MHYTKAMKEEISSLYELYIEGKISLDEREDRIEKIKNQKLVLENVDFSLIDDSLSPMEQFEELKKIVYERCTQGLINEEEREQIISEYRDSIFTE